jgi:GT2 family glycosyltransferase
MDNLSPLIRVVVLNYDGGAMTLECLDSILASDWPADRLDVILVDNGSLDDVATVVTRDQRYRDRVTLLEPLRNLGFAAGCNLGLRQPGDWTYALLINNDATLAPDTITQLVAAARRHVDEPVGAIAAKLLFADPAQGVSVTCDDSGVLVPTDPRALGVRVSGVRLDGERDDTRVGFDEGFHLPEPPVVADGEELACWSRRRGAVRITRPPGSEPVHTVSLRLSCLVERQVTLTDERTGDPAGAVTVTVGREPQWVEVTVHPEAFDVINNVGSEWYRDAFAGDRGFLEADRGQFDTPAEVFAWCGGAVLLTRDYLDDVGLFDERLFLYYEDSELSWRGRRRGWRYVYEPTAVVRHRHAASSGVGSEVFRFHTERNRLLVAARHAPARTAVRVVAGELRRCAATLVRHLVVRPLTLRLPVRAEIRFRLRVTLGTLRLLPAMVAARYATVSGARATVRRRTIASWEVDKWAARP